jgi:hypothetical protein
MKTSLGTLELDNECQESQTRLELPSRIVAIFADEATVCLDDGQIVMLKDLLDEEQCLLVSRGGTFSVSDKCIQEIHRRFKENKGKWK